MLETTARHTGAVSATPSPADSHRCLWHLAHPSHALASTPPAAHEARATAGRCVGGSHTGESHEWKCDPNEDGTESHRGVEQPLETRAWRERTGVKRRGAMDELGVRDEGHDEERTGRPGE